ncbi:hypothetical protein TNCV_4225051 [Trichonephila clavipes]|uniref:Mutator-like transposase domain-containing protein n=1 Tax=Trichonephila clavipes TaxID=2585209 RepID=A0A8X6SVT2_TRICX|nr:hypothetical protein TNCV_4225051 [Trichonephila clavipes]
MQMMGDLHLLAFGRDDPPGEMYSSFTPSFSWRRGKEVAEASMQRAALEEVTLTNSSDIISGDGTWKTRGYSSRVSVWAVIGDKTGKCIDAEVMSSF